MSKVLNTKSTDDVGNCKKKKGKPLTAALCWNCVTPFCWCSTIPMLWIASNIGESRRSNTHFLFVSCRHLYPNYLVKLNNTGDLLTWKLLRAPCARDYICHFGVSYLPWLSPFTVEHRPLHLPVSSLIIKIICAPAKLHMGRHIPYAHSKNY